MVQCSKCGRIIPADKAKKQTKRTSAVDPQLARELRQSGSFIPTKIIPQTYCISCAVHTGKVPVEMRAVYRHPLEYAQSVLQAGNIRVRRFEKIKTHVRVVPGIPQLGLIKGRNDLESCKPGLVNQFNGPENVFSVSGRHEMRRYAYPILYVVHLALLFVMVKPICGAIYDKGTDPDLQHVLKCNLQS